MKIDRGAYFYHYRVYGNPINIGVQCMTMLSQVKMYSSQTQCYDANIE